ncbi:MAG: hypothetical protein KAI41_02285 [Hyphomicrobiaceae bacterium]|nr:hypothetical protein [Alphaproteobacteria bacterium]MCK5497342.1 hypothetical protein [Hyphomicrobiaceae bacterium]MCK5549339.1 hypothetical protein [Hyphomicrobiaceae bacterium]
MSDEKKLTPGKIVGGIASVLTTVALVLWGVPYYLKGEVSDLYAAEQKAAAELEPDQNPVQNAADIQAVLDRLESMENRMIARDALFMEYLQAQANRGSD